jgi:hypothetical protein
MINVSDHHTRVKANTPPGSTVQPVMGCILGSQSGRVVDISNSFEIDYSMQDGKFVINEAFLARKQEQCEFGAGGSGCRGRGMHIALQQACVPRPPCQDVFPFPPRPPSSRTADKQVFPKVDVLGWYVTGAAVEETHLHIHKRVRLGAGCGANVMQLRRRRN